MVLAAARWLGIRLDLLSALLIGAVALAAALYSHDNGKQMFTATTFSWYYLFIKERVDLQFQICVTSLQSFLYSFGWPRFRLRLRDFSLHPGICSTVIRSREFDDFCRESDGNH